MNINNSDQEDNADKKFDEAWKTYTQENDAVFWVNYEQILNEARLIQKDFTPVNLPNRIKTSDLAFGDTFLEARLSRKQSKSLRKLIRRERKHTPLLMRLFSTLFGLTACSFYYYSDVAHLMSLEQLLMIGVGLGGLYGAVTMIEDRAYVNKRQKVLLGTQIKIKGEEIVIGGTNQVVDLRYVDHIKHTPIGISLMPYRAKQWKTTKPILVIPRFIEEFADIVKYIETIIAKYRMS